MKMKHYIKPQLILFKMETETLLGASDEGPGILPPESAMSKGHNSFFDSWDSNDEEEQPGFTNKNLWED